MITCTRLQKAQGEARGQKPTTYSIRFQLIFHKCEMYCKAQNRMEGPHGRGGFVGLMFDALYYLTTPVAPLFPHSSSVIYIHVRSTKNDLT